MFAATGKVVAYSTVGADGSFAATAPLPAKALRTSNRARYQAIIGSEVSAQIKLARRVIVTDVTRAGRSVTFRGRITLPLGRPIQRVTIERRVGCVRTKVVKRFTPATNGRFAVTIVAPVGATSAVYVLRTMVRNSGRGAKLFATRSLPRDVIVS